MASQTDEAIVLRLSEYSESSQIVSLLTRKDGQVRLIAKGSRRSTKLKPSIGFDFLEYGEATYVSSRGDSGLGTLTEWRLRDAFLNLRGRLIGIYAGLYASEMCAATVQEHDAHPDLFEALRDFLGRSAAAEQTESKNEIVGALVRFQASLLTSIGYAPNLRQCVGCGRARARGAPAWFSSHGGGLLCKHCHVRFADQQPLSAHLLDSPRGTTDPREWFGLLDYHLTQICGRPFSSAVALRSVLVPCEKAL